MRKIDYHLLTSVDDIMWLLNIRGNDVKYSPLLTSFAIVGKHQILLFTEESRIPYKLAAEFDKLGIVILPYEETAVCCHPFREIHLSFSHPRQLQSAFHSIPARYENY